MKLRGRLLAVSLGAFMPHPNGTGVLSVPIVHRRTQVMSKATKTKTTKTTKKVVAEDKTVTAVGIKAEQGRRAKNKSRDKADRTRPSSYLYGSLGADEMTAILAGEPVVKAFKSGRTVTVTLR